MGVQSTEGIWTTCMMGDCLVKGLCVPLDSMIVTVSKKGSMIHITFQARKEKKKLIAQS